MYGDFQGLTGCSFCGRASGHVAGCPNEREEESTIEKVGICEICGDPIYTGDEIIRYDGQIWHSECFNDEYGAEA